MKEDSTQMKYRDSLSVSKISTMSPDENMVVQYFKDFVAQEKRATKMFFNSRLCGPLHEVI